MKSTPIIVILVAIATTGAGSPSVEGLPPAGSRVTGIVVDAEGPVEGATVRVQATVNETLTNAEGKFVLPGLAGGETVTLSAWKQDYYCSLIREVAATTGPLLIRLERYQTSDNPAYAWIPPYGDKSCSTCHPAVAALWAKGAHSRSVKNSRFLSMYNGTDVEGNRSPPTRRRFAKDYGSVPLLPDPRLPYFGPGFKLDFPDIAGNCASCHIPGAAVDAPYGTDPNRVAGADVNGIHCDYCHKIATVLLDHATGEPYPNRPGVLSQDIRRPFLEGPASPQLFFGTLDDPNAESGDACLPLLSQSRFCAPCHFASFWGVPVYNSFGEWSASPYSDPLTGKTCQQCHMPSPSILEGKALTNLAPGNGGLEREPAAIHAHSDLGASDDEFLRDAISLRASASKERDHVEVMVTVKNEKAGHHYPTDSPLRHLLLVVEAKDRTGAALDQVGGSKLPLWAGVGDASRGYVAGLPGQAYAKILEESWTGISPTGAYWNSVRVVSDNRLAALASDTTSYTFRQPAAGDAQVTVTLLFRRAYIALMDWKGWDTPDIVLAKEILHVPR